MIRAGRDACVEHLRAHAFGLVAGGARPPRIGAEVELIPVESGSRRIAPIDAGAGAPSTRAALRALAARAGWCERISPKSGQPEFVTPTGGRVTFEPGGQVEYASAPLASLTALLGDLRQAADGIREALGNAGFEVVCCGIDPVNPVEEVPLQVDGPRYRRMDRHFAWLGPHGARMMRQTASIQVAVDLGEHPLSRWRLLSGVAPVLAAMFANAPAYGGRMSDRASVRRLAWECLDPGRTGLPYDAVRPVEAYADFALGAAAILGSVDTPPFPAFRDLPAGSDPRAGWEAHLSTLFPEVRPRGYFEVRSIDAVEPAWYAAPLVMVAGLALDPDTAAAALEVTGDPDPSLLEPAGRLGLAEPALARMAGELSRLALRGCESLGPDLVDEAVLEEAAAFFSRFTWAARVPADETQPSAVG